MTRYVSLLAPRRATGSRAIGPLLVCGLLLSGCRAPRADEPPSIQFTTVPPVSVGGSQTVGTIAGRVTRARPGQRIVLFAKADVWWVQPFANQPFTLIQPDSTWKSQTHLVMTYAALLVDQGYRPPGTTATLPKVGGAVIAVATVEGTGRLPQPRMLQFSGYTWEVRQVPSDRGGDNVYDAANAWVDTQGLLHLRI